jgi:hypothetical protein
MTIEERAEMYKNLFPECRAIASVSKILDKGYTGGTPLQRLELLRELDTDLAEAYSVFIPVITCWVRDNSYVRETKEIFLGEPDLEGFLHQFRHHLQNEARGQERKYLLVEEDTKIDPRIPYKDAINTMYGEDDSKAWAKMIMESVQ